MKTNETDILVDMEKNLISNKEMFSKSDAIEKLAFKRVSEEEKTTEVEQLFADSVLEPIKVVAQATPAATAIEGAAPAGAHKAECKACKGFFVRDAGGPQCACPCKTPMECKNNANCTCHTHPAKQVVDFKFSATSAVKTLVSLSNDLDDNGFDKLAAATLLLADKIVAEAKAKTKSKSKSKSKKDEKSKSKSKSKKDEKSKSKSKMDVKERMKKMREMRDKKKSTEKK
jgi:hypothetical protein